ncbi:MAG TPA: ADP-ribosyltransferase [Acetobacteraceae bacterium]
MSGSVSLDHFVKVLSGGLIITDALLELRNRKVQEVQDELGAEIGRLTKVGLHSGELSHVADELEQARQSAMRKGDNRAKADALERVKTAGRTVVGDARKKVDRHLADQQSYLDKQQKARAAIEAAQGAVERIDHQPSLEQFDGKLRVLQQLFIKLSSTDDVDLLQNHARELENCALEASRLGAAAAGAKPAAGRGGASKPRGVTLGTRAPADTAQPTQPPATEAKPPRGIALGTSTPAGAATPTQRGTSVGTSTPADAAQSSQPPTTEAKPPRGIALGTSAPADAAQPSQPPTTEAKPPRGTAVGTSTPADTAMPTQPAQPPATEATPPDGSIPGTAAPPDAATPAHPHADIGATPSDLTGAPAKPLAERLRDDPNAAKMELLNRGMDRSKFESRHFAASAQAEAVNEDISNLSEGEVVALYSYTTEDYTNMNRVEINKRKKPGTEIPIVDIDPVSGKTCEQRPDVLEVLNEVTKIGLSKLPPLGETTTRRGERDWDGWEEVYVKDQTFKCQGFWSTTTAKPFPGKLQITITGRGGKKVSHLSQYADEDEVLYQPDTEFRVVDRQDERDSAGGLTQSLIVVVEV